MKINPGKLFKEVILTLLMVVVTMTGYNLYLQKDMPSGSAPELQAVQTNGKTIDLQTLSKDQPVLVYFWASWCSVCSWVSPSVSTVSDSYPVVSVALASGDEHRVQRYLTAKNLEFSAITDDEGSISSEWGVNVTPSLFIVKAGEIKSITTGYTTTAGLLMRLWWYGL